MRSLPKQLEMIIIQNAKDITKLLLEELIDSLMAHRITMKRYGEVKDKEKKSITLKASIDEDEEETPSEEGEDFAFIARKFKKLMNFKRNKRKKSCPKKESLNKKEYSNNDKKKDLICYKCKKPRHIKYECPLYNNETKKGKKKAMILTLSDSEENVYTLNCFLFLKIENNNDFYIEYKNS